MPLTRRQARPASAHPRRTRAEGDAARISAGTAPRHACPRSTRRPSRPMSAKAMPRRSPRLRPRRSRSAPIARRRLHGAGGSGSVGQRGAARDLADPRHRRHPPGLRHRLQEAVRDQRFLRRLGRRDRGPPADRHANARRTRVPDHGTLRHAGRDPVAARRQRRQHRRSGSPTRCAPPSPSRKAPPSSPATASTSRRASSTTRRSPTPAWTWGNIGTIATGVAGAFPASNPADKLIDLVYAVKAGYRANGTFVMNRATQGGSPQAEGRRRRLSVATRGASPATRRR